MNCVWSLLRSLIEIKVLRSLISVAKLHFSNNVLLGLVPYKFVGCDFVGRAGVHTKGQGRKWRKNGSKLVRHKKHAIETPEVVPGKFECGGVLQGDRDDTSEGQHWRRHQSSV